MCRRVLAEQGTLRRLVVRRESGPLFDRQLWFSSGSAGCGAFFISRTALRTADGKSALDALRIYRPSLLLLDIGMPGMDGYDLARQVRQIPEFFDLVLIALTGWRQDEDRRRTKEAGFDHHLVKPIEIGTLQGLLASLEATGRHVKSAAGQPANVAVGPTIIR
jgi:CheY-like chemotaxis protein